ncbi:MAG TPA: hypothetical protein VN827_03485 [Chthoniobacterales bacterium]|nr:hypothetical protein [Chthoniobacterales bacterium]
MNHLEKIFWIVCVVFGSVISAPAPIFEAPEPTATPAAVKPKPKPESIESNHISKSARSFQGAWTATVSSTDQNNTVFTAKKTLLISDRTAVVVSELTMARPAGGTWSDLPAAINASPLQVKVTYRSDNLKLGGSNLIINWRPPQVSNWFPKEIPLHIRQTFESGFTKSAAANPATTYTLNGDKMTGENAGFKAVYQRVK